MSETNTPSTAPESEVIVDPDEKCFLTNVACGYKGLPDSCKELQTLREYRDLYLANSEGGVELIAHYQRVSPAISAWLKGKETELERIWIQMSTCVRLIESGRPDLAKGRYVAMVKGLSRAYEATGAPSTVG